jgi:LPS-assembly protein
MIMKLAFIAGFFFGVLVWFCPLNEGCAEEVSAGTLPGVALSTWSASLEQPPAATSEEAVSAEEDLEPKPLSLEADSLAFDQASGTYEAKGHVVLRQGDLLLTADQILLQSATQDVFAEGSVQVRQADDQLSGDRIHYNLSTGVGSVRQGRVFLSEKNFHLMGAAVEKSGEATYHVTDGRFTTCDGEVPDWEFTASQVDITLGRYATVRHAWFRVHDAPVLYFPYLVFPVRAERESGLLLPRFGYSQKQGFKSSFAWYQVVSRNQDATLYLDYLSKKGLGKGLEYRYIFDRDNQGQATYYHVSGISETPDLFAFEWEHGGTLPGNVRLTADVRYADDRQFFEDFGESAEDYNRDQTLATVIVQRNWEKFNLAGHARYLKDLEGDNDTTLQKLPELSAVVPRYRLGAMPVYVGFESYATRYDSDEADDGERLSLRPSVGAVFRPGSWLELSPDIALSQRYYSSDAEDNEATVPEYALTLSTRVHKVFPFERWGLDSVRHSVEPAVTYVYVPNIEQDDLPLFSLADRLDQQNRIEYALINRFTAKSTHIEGPPTYRDILKLRLSQSYDVAEARDQELDDQEPFSDLRIEVDVLPTQKSFVSMDGRVAVYNATVFNRLDIEASLDDGHGNRFEGGYHYRRARPGATVGTDLNADYLNAVVETAMFRPVYLHLEERYDLLVGRALETVVGIEYRARCWSMILTFQDRLNDQQVMVNFVLAGLSGSDGFW